MYVSVALREPLGDVKTFQPKLFGRIKVKLLLSTNIENLGIVEKLVNNINI